MHDEEPPICPYCRCAATLLRSSAALYGGQDFGPIWCCLKVGCEAWVGCHPGTERPLGRLANAELRVAKTAAHKAFDRLWRGKVARDRCSPGQARAAGYRWLAEQLGIEPRDCHIGMMGVELCRCVVAACRPFHGENRTEGDTSNAGQ